MLRTIRTLAAGLTATLGCCGLSAAGPLQAPFPVPHGPGPYPGLPMPTFNEVAPNPNVVPMLPVPYFTPYRQIFWLTPPVVTAQNVLNRLEELHVPLVPVPTNFLGKEPPEAPRIVPKDKDKKDELPEDKNGKKKEEKAIEAR